MVLAGFVERVGDPVPLVAADGSISSPGVYRALARNQAQLTYNGVGPWLEGTAAPPPKVAASSDLAAQLKLQDEAARILLQAWPKEVAAPIALDISGVLTDTRSGVLTFGALFALYFASSGVESLRVGHREVCSGMRDLYEPCPKLAPLPLPTPQACTEGGSDPPGVSTAH